MPITAPATPSSGRTPAPQAPAVPDSGPRPLVPGSPLARALYEVWRGRPVTIIQAPPGSGKSTLIADIVDHLAARTDLVIDVCAFTRDATVSVAGRIAEQVGPSKVVCTVSGWPTEALPEDVASPSEAHDISNPVKVGTLASRARNRTGEADLLIIDEAYQATFDLVSAAANTATQVLLVGDPGQIGPVVTTNTIAWDHLRMGPHMRAPEVFAQREDAISIQMDATFRLGPLSTSIVAPLYDFDFACARPERHVIDAAEVEVLKVPRTDDPYSLETAKLVAKRAASFVGRTLVEADGSQTLLSSTDVAVVVSHNAQQSAIEGTLSRLGIVGVSVGTADRLQGGQWHVVVALDPLLAKDSASSHSLSSGRLCVMLSRHMTHLSWVTDGAWQDSLTQESDLDASEVAKGRAVREMIEQVAA
ncbi:AAA family ATPase [Oerskovia sp. NPDC060338]|uniref:AAA family ATPase n=1 Tax=Oerskovia sp. NPDC060338 TaxID=3347100 RepID=UPI00365484AC